MKDFAHHLSPATAETCATYNLLKLTRHVFTWEPDSRFMDFYERALFNQILASQQLDKNRPGEFFEVDHAIPATLTEGKQHVTVKFQAHPGATAGGLFGLLVLKP